MEEQNHRSYYAIIPANVRYDKDLTASAKLLYGEITALCNEKGYCWASNAYFAELYGVSKSSVSNWVSALSKAGYISVDLIYKDGSKEVKARHIRIITETPMRKNSDTPIKDFTDPYKKSQTPLREISDNNTKYNNTNNNTNNKRGKTRNQNRLVTKTKSSKAKEILTMRSMIDAFSQDETIRKWLLKYFDIRIKTGLKPEQWEIILEDLKTYSAMNEEVIVEKTRGAIAGGYRQIIASWEKTAEKKQNRKPGFDNLKGETKLWKTKEEQRQHFKEREEEYIRLYGKQDEF